MKVYIVRLFEKVVTTAASGFFAAWTAAGTGYGKAALVAGLAGAFAALYGLVVGPIGDMQRPDLSK